MGKERKTAEELGALIKARMTTKANVTVGADPIRKGEWFVTVSVWGDAADAAVANADAQRVANTLRSKYDLITSPRNGDFQIVGDAEI
jgi:hypothetical protein